MPRLVTKFKYMKPGKGKSVGGYAKYIATREGVEKIDDSHKNDPATQAQKDLISKFLRDFPDAKQGHEFADYMSSPTKGNATEFISRTLEENMDSASDSKTYADYIATRPGAERIGSHGLFTDEGMAVHLGKVSEELNSYPGNVYTMIVSLRREDGERLGFNAGARWRDLLRGHTDTLAENFKIPMDHLRWYAAFHNEGHHPHIHLIAYSSVPGEGHLSKQGVEKIRSALARDIFDQDMLHIYEQQSDYRDRLREQGRETVVDIVEQINSGGYSNSKVENLLLKLSDRLSRTSGKKVYGYLKADVKAIVDSIVAELAKDERVQKLYNLWYEQREAVLRTYTDHFPERIPLEQNKEFKTIRNMVIQEALKITNIDMQVECAAYTNAPREGAVTAVSGEIADREEIPELPSRPSVGQEKGDSEMKNPPAEIQREDRKAYTAAQATVGLLKNLSRMIKMSSQQQKQPALSADKKRRQELEQKKQALGIMD